MTVRLHVNVDHVATLRQARGTPYPDPVEAAKRCMSAGAHGITIHLREDRRHIQDDDVARMRRAVSGVLNLEMAATEEMTRIAIETKPDLVTLVPERRAERTTEGGLDCVGGKDSVAKVVDALRVASIGVSVFIDPESAQIDAAVALGVRGIELHTGDYAHASGGKQESEVLRLAQAARHASRRGTGLEVAAGHGLTAANVGALVENVPQIIELNIGHALVADAVFDGLENAVRNMLDAIARGAGARTS